MTDKVVGEGGLLLGADILGPADGPPVVLAPGAGQTRRSWRKVADRLAAAGYRVVSIDLRGHGDSEWSPDGDYTYPRLSADLTAVLAGLGQPAVLVGASLGGKAGMVAAAADAAGVMRALVLVDTAPRTRSEGTDKVGAAMRTPPGGFASPQAAAEHLAALRGQPAKPDAGERLARTMRQNPDGSWGWHWDPEFFGRDHKLGTVGGLETLEAAARKVRIPTLIVYGAQSDVVDETAVNALKALIPQAEVACIEGAGHMLVGDSNSTFGDALLGFLERVCQKAACLQ